MPAWAWWTLLWWNCAVFALFGWDKLCAARGWRRVREAHLLLAVFLCGCIGAEAGARAFRHKTRKSSFRRLALALSVLNPLWLLVWLEFGG